ncbi:hypothetical protein, partial [Roseomonas sp. KE2513]|uniref:hypothetical protein n=1 Tax=Roseomonas sp. KE2513 TaxID=2479202 RepID=UPI001E3731C0
MIESSEPVAGLCWCELLSHAFSPAVVVRSFDKFVAAASLSLRNGLQEGVIRDVVDLLGDASITPFSKTWRPLRH